MYKNMEMIYIYFNPRFSVKGCNLNSLRIFEVVLIVQSNVFNKQFNNTQIVPKKPAVNSQNKNYTSFCMLI